MGPYLSNKRLLDTQYDIRIEDDNFKIGKSSVTTDNMSNITTMAKQFKGTEDFWKRLIRKNMNYNLIHKNDLQSYKTILEILMVTWKDTKPGATFRLLAERS